MSSNHKSDKNRIKEADLLKVMALIMMIHGHTFSEILDVSDTGSLTYSVWQYLRGLTAPLFLVCSGLVHVFANKRDSSGNIKRHILVKRVKRSFLLLVLGYALHLPPEIYAGNFDFSNTSVAGFLLVDILQLFAFSFILYVFVQNICRNEKNFFYVSIALFLIVSIVSPLVNEYSAGSSLPVFITNYLDLQNGSYFPLFPFISYVFLGAAAGSAIKFNHNRPAVFLVFTIVLLTAGIILCIFPINYETGEIKYIDPGLIFIYCSVILSLMFLFGKVKLPGYIIEKAALISRHSLNVYLVHLFLLYGIGPVGGLIELAGKNNEPMTAIVYFLAVLAVSFSFVIITEKIIRIYKSNY